MMRVKLGIAACFLLISFTANSESTITLIDGWINEAPPNVSVLAGYGLLHNHGEHNRTLTEITSPDFEYIELHRSEITDGVAKMIQMTEALIKANSELRFEPGGKHLMLFEPKKPLRKGDQVELNLHFSDGSTISSTVQIKKYDSTHSSHHHHH